MSPHRRIFAVLTLSTVACGGGPGASFSSDPSGPAADPSSKVVGISPTPAPDGGSPEADPPAVDGGAPSDDAAPVQDDASPQAADAAPDVVVVADGGAADSAPDVAVVIDSGADAMIDSGSSPAADAGTDAAPVVDGAADAQSDGGSSVDAADAAPPPPQCLQEGLTECGTDGVSPLVCHNQQLISNGGACAFGCNAQTGACNCQAPAARFQVPVNPGLPEIEDMVTNHIFGIAGYGPGTTLAGDTAICSGNEHGTLASLAVLQAEFSQAAPSNECGPDFDSRFLKTFGFDSTVTYINTPATCALPNDAGMGYVSVLLSNGEVICAEPYAFICVQ